MLKTAIIQAFSELHSFCNNIDDCKKYSNNEKVLNIMRIAKMWHRDTKWENAVGEMVPIDLFNSGLLWTFN